MNNKILFADLDHTLLCDDKSISEKNRAAIQQKQIELSKPHGCYAYLIDRIISWIKGTLSGNCAFTISKQRSRLLLISFFVRR